MSLIERYGARIPEPSVIPVLVDTNVPEPVRLPPHPSFTFALITVGRLEPEKRIEDILSALKLVSAHYPMVGLFIVGEGVNVGSLSVWYVPLGPQEKVIFLGNRPDARGLMASAHAFIQASAYEGYGRTLVEAALAKVPIITTDVGIVGEVFKGYEDVLSVPVADPTALSLSIVGFIEDNAVRQTLLRTPRRPPAPISHQSVIYQRASLPTLHGLSSIYEAIDSHTNGGYQGSHPRFLRALAGRIRTTLREDYGDLPTQREILVPDNVKSLRSKASRLMRMIQVWDIRISSLRV